MAVIRVENTKVLEFTALAADTLPTLLQENVGSIAWLSDTDAWKRWDGSDWQDWSRVSASGSDSGDGGDGGDGGDMTSMGGGFNPPTVGGARLYRLVLWQRKAGAAPAVPPASWYSTSTMNGIVDDLGSWHRTKAEATAAVSSGTYYFAVDDVTVNPFGAVAYTGWQRFAEFGVQYSADGSTWDDGPQDDDDRFFAFLNSDGTRSVIEIPDSTSSRIPDWNHIYTGYPYNRSGQDGVSGLFGSILELDHYERFRFTINPFGRFLNNAPASWGGEGQAILHKPRRGWDTAGVDDANLDDAMFGFKFDDNGDGFTVWVLESDAYAGFSSIFSKRTGTNRALNSISFRMKFLRETALGTDISRARGFRLFGFAGGSNNARFQFRIEGSAY